MNKIYLISNKENLKTEVKSIIKEINSSTKVIDAYNFEELINDSNDIDIIIIDIELLVNNYNKINETLRKKIICLITNIKHIRYIEAIQPCYFIFTPINKEIFIKTLNIFINSIKSSSIIIKTIDGDERLFIKELNYINIENRCLSYHLTDGTNRSSMCLRTSFINEVEPILKHKDLYFVPKTLIVNLNNIRGMDKTFSLVIFENNDTITVPKKYFDELHDTWKEYCENE